MGRVVECPQCFGALVITHDLLLHELTVKLGTQFRPRANEAICAAMRVAESHTIFRDVMIIPHRCRSHDTEGNPA